MQVRFLSRWLATFALVALLAGGALAHGGEEAEPADPATAVRQAITALSVSPPNEKLAGELLAEVLERAEEPGEPASSVADVLDVAAVQRAQQALRSGRRDEAVTNLRQALLPAARTEGVRADLEPLNGQGATMWEPFTHKFTGTPLEVGFLGFGAALIAIGGLIIARAGERHAP